jgi:hypothetical protein
LRAIDNLVGVDDPKKAGEHAGFGKAIYDIGAGLVDGVGVEMR